VTPRVFVRIFLICLRFPSPRFLFFVFLPRWAKILEGFVIVTEGSSTPFCTGILVPVFPTPPLTEVVGFFFLYGAFPYSRGNSFFHSFFFLSCLSPKNFPLAVHLAATVPRSPKPPVGPPPLRASLAQVAQVSSKTPTPATSIKPVLSFEKPFSCFIGTGSGTFRCTPPGPLRQVMAPFFPCHCGDLDNTIPPQPGNLARFLLTASPLKRRAVSLIF